MRKIVFVSVGLLIVALTAVFASLNPAVVPVDLVLGKADAPLIYIVVVSLIIGWILGLISLGVALLRLVGQRRQLRRELRLAEKEIQNLRSIHEAKLPAASGDASKSEP